MFRRGRHHFTECQQNTTNSSPEPEETFIEANTSREWLDKHPLTEEEQEFERRQQQKSTNSTAANLGKKAVRRSMWDLPDWYR